MPLIAFRCIANNIGGIHKRIHQRGSLHCFINGLISSHLREGVGGRGADAARADGFGISGGVVCGDQALLKAEPDELMCAPGTQQPR